MKIFVGIDIQERRGCCFAAIAEDGAALKSGWFSEPEKEVGRLVRTWKEKDNVFVGIDAPRMPLPSPWKWYWDGSRSMWDTEKGYGRHCEAVVSAHRIANPQWTPLEGEAPQWMITGFKMFLALRDTVPVYEVFPTASYALLHGITDARICIDFSAFKPGPKDMLDAFVAAETVREFDSGRGTEGGGGDGLGTIVLPRPLPDPVIKEALSWPKAQIE